MCISHSASTPDLRKGIGDICNQLLKKQIYPNSLSITWLLWNVNAGYMFLFISQIMACRFCAQHFNCQKSIYLYHSFSLQTCSMMYDIPGCNSRQMKPLPPHLTFVLEPIDMGRFLLLMEPGPRLNIKTVLSTYGDFHVKDKTAVRTSYL